MFKGDAPRGRTVVLYWDFENIWHKEIREPPRKT
ncbi:hypothetical protein J2W27_004593 [Variovorax boronicumulans]|nr:hypothetical protein [Variovorax boronicumulans]